MRCEDVELALVEGARSDLVEEHLAACEACQRFERDLSGVLEAGALPPLSPAERAALASIESDTWRAWERAQRPPRSSLLGYAAAATLGALAASAAFWVVRPVREVPVERALGPSLSAGPARDDDPNLSSDDVFFDVTWPDISEGGTP